MEAEKFYYCNERQFTKQKMKITTYSLLQIILVAVHLKLVQSGRNIPEVSNVKMYCMCFVVYLTRLNLGNFVNSV